MLIHAEAAGLHQKWVLVEPDHAALEHAVHPLEQAAEAHKIGETGRTPGKIVLSITP